MKSTVHVKVRIACCLRCDHEWALRTEKPKVCPNCRSPYWDIPGKDMGIGQSRIESFKADYLRLNKNKHNRDFARKHYLGLGKGVILHGLAKRPYPSSCEMCSRSVKRLDYHHWDDATPSLGIWTCIDCHRVAESVDKGLYDKGLHIVYMKLKEKIINEGLDTTYPGNRCSKCGHEWMPRVSTPKRCPKCFRHDWR